MSSLHNSPFTQSPLNVPELFLEVLSRLPYKHVKRIRRVCSTWRAACDQITAGKEMTLTIFKIVGETDGEDQVVRIPMYLKQRVRLDSGSAQTVLEFVPAIHRDFPRLLTIPTALTFAVPNSTTKVMHLITRHVPNTHSPPRHSPPPMAGPFGLGQAPDGPDHYASDRPHLIHQIEPYVRFGKPFREGISAIFSPFFTVRFGSNRPLTQWIDNTSVMSLTLPVDWSTPPHKAPHTPQNTVYSHARRKLLAQVYSRHKSVFHRDYEICHDFFSDETTHDYLSRPHPAHWPLIPRLLKPQMGSLSLQHFAIELQRLMDRTKIVECMSFMTQQRRNELVNKYRSKTLQMWNGVVGCEAILKLSGFESEDEGELFAFLVSMTKSQNGGWVV